MILDDRERFVKLENNLRDDILNGAQAAADWLGLSRRTIYDMTEKGFLPCARFGQRIFYRKSELDQVFRAAAA